MRFSSKVFYLLDVLCFSASSCNSNKSKSSFLSILKRCFWFNVFQGKTVGMVYYIYIYYYIYYNIYNNIYKSIGNIFGCKIDFRDGTMVRWYEIVFCGFSASRLESGTKITRIWEIEVRNLVDRWVLVLPLLRSSF